MAETAKIRKVYLIFNRHQDVKAKRTYTDLLQICEDRTLAGIFARAFVANDIAEDKAYYEKEPYNSKFLWTTNTEFSDEDLFNPDGVCYKTLGWEPGDTIIDIFSIVIKEVEVKDG